MKYSGNLYRSANNNIKKYDSLVQHFGSFILIKLLEHTIGVLINVFPFLLKWRQRRTN